MAFGESNGHVTDDVMSQTSDLNTLAAQYLENSWRCYLATNSNYYIVCAVGQYGRLS